MDTALNQELDQEAGEVLSKLGLDRGRCTVRKLIRMLGYKPDLEKLVSNGLVVLDGKKIYLPSAFQVMRENQE